MPNSTPSLPVPESGHDRTHLDVRPIACRQKHSLIFQRWAALAVGEYFILINDHDPVPLYYQFAGQFPGAFAWEYLVSGPDEFQVKITRLAATAESAGLMPPRPGMKPGAATPAPKSLVTRACGTETELEVDARGLEPPEPMMRILAAVERLAPGASLRARTDRRPLHLLPELEARGLDHIGEEFADGTWSLRVTKP